MISRSLFLISVGIARAGLNLNGSKTSVVHFAGAPATVDPEARMAVCVEQLTDEETGQLKSLSLTELGLYQVVDGSPMLSVGNGLYVVRRLAGREITRPPVLVPQSRVLKGNSAL